MNVLAKVKRMPRKSVDKGKRFEREVAAALSTVYLEARRGLAQPRDGTETPDVEGTPFWVECKVGQQINVQAALSQAVDATAGRPPLAICKVDGDSATVTLRLDNFIKLIADGDRNEAAPAPLRPVAVTPRG